MTATVAALVAQGVPLRLVQYMLVVAGGRGGMKAAMALHPPDEYAHVRMLRASYEACERSGELFGPPDDEP